MSYNLLIPKKKMEVVKNDARPQKYRDSYWKDFSDKAEYDSRIRYLQNEIKNVVDLHVPVDKKLYMDVKLDPAAKSKTSKPREIWKVSSIDIVSSNDPLKVTVSGKKSGFEKISKFLESTSFDAAKTGIGVKRSEETIYRELFSISKFTDINQNTASRISDSILKLIALDSDQYVDCLIEIQPDQNLSEYLDFEERLLSIIPRQNLERRNPDFFDINGMAFNAKLNGEEMLSILSKLEFNFISNIVESTNYSLQRCIPELRQENVTIGEPLTNELIAIVDSGIKNLLVDRFVDLQRFNLLGQNRVEDPTHGTFVASRVLFGNKIFPSSGVPHLLRPVGKLIDVKVAYKADLPDEPPNLEKDDIIMGGIDKILSMHPDVKLFNLSFGERNSATGAHIDPLTSFIDARSREHDVLFICAAGNHPSHKQALSYEEIFSDIFPNNGICSPGDSLNSLTVGAIAESANETAICKVAGYPSPFTRRGGIRGGIKKPEVVAEGGNLAINYGKDPSINKASHAIFGVEGISVDGFCKDVGTSFAAPVVTHECARILHYVKNSSIANDQRLNGNQANLIKALLIHSATKNGLTVIKDENIRKAFGFGRSSLLSATSDQMNQVSFVYFDTISSKNKSQVLKITLPDNFLGKPIQGCFTLVYNPPTNKKFYPYQMLSLMPALRLKMDSTDEALVNEKKAYRYLQPSKFNWDAYKNKGFNTINFAFKKRKIESLDLEVSLNMNVSSDYKFQGKSFDQKYAFVFTIINQDGQRDVRKELLDSDQFQEIIQNEIDIPNQIEL